MSAQTDDTYALGRTTEEEQRLQDQSRLLAPATRNLFSAAGIGPGMKVLDLGSGAGDVAMLVAEMVGPAGQVIGVDVNPTILQTATRRARAAGHTNITFVLGDIREIPLGNDFDAVVGRLILMYFRDPSAVLRHLLPHLRPGGVAAFYEIDYTVQPSAAYPPSALSDQIARWVPQAMAFAGVETVMGMKLHQAFRDAGLDAPQIAVNALMGGSHTFVEDFTAWAVESTRSLLPLLIKGGIATEEEVGIETLATRWRDELLMQGSVIRGPLFMGAWARKA